jgi:hypothetical protein
MFDKSPSTSQSFIKITTQETLLKHFLRRFASQPNLGVS